MKRKCCVSVTVPDILANYDSTGPVLDYEAIFNRPQQPQQPRPQEPRPQDPVDGTQSSEPYIPFIPVTNDPVDDPIPDDEPEVWTGGAQLPSQDITGCIDPSATNYNPRANIIGSCTYAVPGCMDTAADNYNPSATVAPSLNDPRSCTYSGGGEVDVEDTTNEIPSSICSSTSRGTLTTEELSYVKSQGWRQNASSDRLSLPSEGLESTEEYFCAVTAPCKKSNTDYTGTLSFASEGIGNFLDDAGIELPSLDNFVCDRDKERILNDIVDILSKLTDVEDLLDDHLPAWLARLVASNPLVDQVEGIALGSKAAIQFGRGEFDSEVVASILNLPGLDQFMNHVIELANTNPLETMRSGGSGGGDPNSPPITSLSNSLTPEQKELILDNAPMAFIPINIAFPLSAPVTGIIGALILLGRKMWDEALEAMLSLGLSQLGSKIVEPLTAGVKKVTDAAKAARGIT